MSEISKETKANIIFLLDYQTTVTLLHVLTTIHYYINTRFITAGWCGDMECDAEKKLLIHDLDGSFTGSSGSAYIIPQADRAWDSPETSRGIGDFRIPGAMQTYLNGTRIDIELVRKHTGKIHLIIYLTNIFQNNYSTLMSKIKLQVLIFHKVQSLWRLGRVTSYKEQITF